MKTANSNNVFQMFLKIICNLIVYNTRSKVKFIKREQLQFTWNHPHITCKALLWIFNGKNRVSGETHPFTRFTLLSFSFALASLRASRDYPKSQSARSRSFYPPFLEFLSTRRCLAQKVPRRLSCTSKIYTLRGSWQKLLVRLPLYYLSKCLSTKCFK